MTPTRKHIAPARPGLLLAAMLASGAADASMFKGEALDAVADFMTWIVLIIVPIVAIAVFWLVHILPEKIAYKRKHPQAQAIHTLCLLSLVFGGMLWPLAWLWAFSKPVLYKMAYGTDVAENDHGKDVAKAPAANAPAVDELAQLRKRLAALEAQVGQGGQG
jgi:CBS domain containing-hemolysin-like protein